MYCMQRIVTFWGIDESTCTKYDELNSYVYVKISFQTTNHQYEQQIIKSIMKRKVGFVSLHEALKN